SREALRSPTGNRDGGVQWRTSAVALFASRRAIATMAKDLRRYRLTVRTEPSQGLNTGSIPLSATKHFKINHLQNWRTEPMYKRYNGLRGNSLVNPLSPPL